MGGLLLAALAVATSAAATQAAGDAPALAEAVVPSAAPISSGALGTLTLPALSVPPSGSVALGLGLDWYRGGNFLLPGATSQRAGAVVSVAAGLGGFLEVYGSLAFRDSILFSDAGHQTLGTWGDADLGLKALLPRAGPLLAGGLVELDLPAGSGGASLRGTGGRAALLGGLAGDVGGVPLVFTALVGYHLDNSGKLVAGRVGTFPAFALDISLYDTVQGALSLQAPLKVGAPVVELTLAAPVARGTPLPQGGAPALARLLLGVAQARTGVTGLTATAGVSLSLSRTGRLAPDALPLAGYAPDPPWSLLASVAYAFEPQRLSRARPSRSEAVEARAADASMPAAPTRGRLVVLATDARTQQPVAGAWVSVLESNDVGRTTGPDGRAALDVDEGALTLAVARDGYELATESVQLSAGEERRIALVLQPLPSDAVARGRLLADDGGPVRATVEVLSAAAQPGATTPGTNVLEARLFEGQFSIALPHGSYLIVAATPGYRAQPVRIELRPGETVSRDLVLRRLPSERPARAVAGSVQFARSFPFEEGTATLQAAAQPLLADVAAAFADAGGLPLQVAVRIGADEPGAEDAVHALALSEERAAAIVAALIQRGVARTQLSARGLGAGRPGEALVEIRRLAR